MNGENTDENPGVNRFSTINDTPNPNLPAKRRRNRVEATTKARLTMARLVSIFLRKRSFTEKAVSLIAH
jgi:hypothetical protein